MTAVTVTDTNRVTILVIAIDAASESVDEVFASK